MNDHKSFTKIFPIYCALISPCVQFPGAIFWLVLTSPSLSFHVHLPVIGGERGSASHICLMVHLCLRHTPEQVSMINVWKNGWRNEQIIILNLRQVTRQLGAKLTSPSTEWWSRWEEISGKQKTQDAFLF